MLCIRKPVTIPSTAGMSVQINALIELPLNWPSLITFTEHNSH